MKIHLTRMVAGFAGGVILLHGLLAGAACAYSSEELFARFGERVLQVRILDRSTGLKAGFGSGFVVSKGLIATNYHVVAEMVMEPDLYLAEYHHEDGSSGSLSLTAVDVVNDLALLRAERLEEAPLELAARRLLQGEQLHALGNPYDLGLTIVDGTYNGLQEKSLYDRIHFTGSINPGMSGGPALDRFGRVVGINVATAGNQVSFLVPVDKLRSLMSSEPMPDKAEQRAAAIGRQLLANQQRYYSELLAAPFPRIALGDYTLPGELADYVHCWGHSRKKEEALFELSFQSCGTQDEVFLSEDLSVGSVSFRHELFSSSGLDRLRFYNMLERRAQRRTFSFSGDEEDLSRFSCSAERVDLGGMNLKVLLCMRGYARFEGLYDLYLSAFTVHDPSQSLHTSLALTGVSADNAETFLKNYLGGIAWRAE